MQRRALVKVERGDVLFLRGGLADRRAVRDERLQLLSAGAGGQARGGLREFRRGRVELAVGVVEQQRR